MSGARLVLECISRNLYPSWDTQNRASLAFAEKLVYQFDKEYVAYEVYCFGQGITLNEVVNNEFGIKES